MMLLCPGGGYAFTSFREAEPLAMSFLSKGFHVCVLDYSVAPARFPTQLQEVEEAMRIICEHSEEWNVDTKHIYMVGQGHLIHDVNGFTLTGCDGKLHYTQKPLSCYSLYADYYWYEIADMICIGNDDTLYYCFPQDGGDVVAKTRLAVEEMYKLYKGKVLPPRQESAPQTAQGAPQCLG